MKKIFLLFFLAVLFVIPNHAQRKSKFLTNKDKTLIIKSILLKSDFLNRELYNGEKKEIVYLSSKNLVSVKLPKIRGIDFVLINRNQLEEKKKIGFLYREFGQFKIKGSKVLISFGNYFENYNAGVNYSDGFIYTFKKVKDKWIGEETDGFGSIS